MSSPPPLAPVDLFPLDESEPRFCPQCGQRLRSDVNRKSCSRCTPSMKPKPIPKPPPPPPTETTTRGEPLPAKTIRDNRPSLEQIRTQHIDSSLKEEGPLDWSIAPLFLLLVALIIVLLSQGCCRPDRAPLMSTTPEQIIADGYAELLKQYDIQPDRVPPWTMWVSVNEIGMLIRSFQQPNPDSCMCRPEDSRDE